MSEKSSKKLNFMLTMEFNDVILVLFTIENYEVFLIFFTLIVLLKEQNVFGSQVLGNFQADFKEVNYATMISNNSIVFYRL